MIIKKEGNKMSNSLALIVLPLLILQLILVIVCIMDLVKRDVATIRGESKILWVLIILFINTIGPILYLTIGRKK
jgi:hypothetical protein